LYKEVKTQMGMIIKIVISAITLIGVSLLTPGFSVRGGVIGAAVAAIVISVLNALAEKIIGEKGKGFTGFAVAVCFNSSPCPLYSSPVLAG